MTIKHLNIQMKEQGFTLIEILVTVVVMGIGLLGLASIQVASIQHNHESYMRSTAAILANDMADRIRSNLATAITGVASTYNNPNGNFVANPNCLGVDNTGSAVTSTCNPAQIALHDFYEWRNGIAGTAATAWHPAQPTSLPNGTGIVCIDSTPLDGTAGAPACDNVVAVAGTPMFAIKIFWNESTNTAGAVTKRYVASFQP